MCLKNVRFHLVNQSILTSGASLSQGLYWKVFMLVAFEGKRKRQQTTYRSEAI